MAIDPQTFQDKLNSAQISAKAGKIDDSLTYIFVIIIAIVILKKRK